MSGTVALLKYDTARLALAEARRVDEAKTIRDKALAVQAYARQAHDTELHQWVTEIRIRAERRTGELLREMKKQQGARGRPGPGRGKKNGLVATEPVLGDVSPTLKYLKITMDESALWQKLAAIPAPAFEARLATAAMQAMRLTTRTILRAERGEQHGATRSAPPWSLRAAAQRVFDVFDAEIERAPTRDDRRLLASIINQRLAPFMGKKGHRS